MFVFSMKTTRPRLAAGGIVTALLVAVTLGLHGRGTPAAAVGAVPAADGAAYLQRLGYEVDPQWVDLREITLPAVGSEAFAALQQQVGVDLTPYAGQRVKCRTYRVLNHPADAVRAYLFEYQERVVAGGFATASGQFCHGLQPLSEVMKNKGETDGTTG